MEIREVRVEFRKTTSDSSYGNETYSVAFTATLSEDEPPGGVAFDLAQRAHDVVLSRLRGSTNEAIRMALETAEEREARHARERAEREAENARWEADRAKRQAARDEAAGEAFAAAQLAEDDDEADEDEIPVEGSPF